MEKQILKYRTTKYQQIEWENLTTTKRKRQKTIPGPGDGRA